MSRPAALLLAWQHRKTLAMWGRSIRDEARHAQAAGRPDVARWKALVPAMWQHRAAAERGTVHTLTVTPDHRVVPGGTVTTPTTASYAGVDVPLGTEVPVAV